MSEKKIISTSEI